MRIFKPYLYFLLDLGFIRLRTSLMNRTYEHDVFEYITLDVQVFKKRFSLDLYKPGYYMRRSK